MSRPKDQSCDNCQYQTKLDTCNQWLDKCPNDISNETEYSVRWCQYWKKRKEK